MIVGVDLVLLLLVISNCFLGICLYSFVSSHVMIQPKIRFLFIYLFSVQFTLSGHYLHRFSLSHPLSIVFGNQEIFPVLLQHLLHLQHGLSNLSGNRALFNLYDAAVSWIGC